jgi:16S rRNA (cytosine967-C5)-methyltransferase
VLPEENQRQALGFLAANPHYSALPANTLWMSHFAGSKVRARFSPEGGVAVTPHSSGTDGFYCIAMRREG